jgi:hypothetical protein
MDFLTPRVWDVLILIVVIVGLALAARRFYQDMTRPPDPSDGNFLDDYKDKKE